MMLSVEYAPYRHWDFLKTSRVVVVATDKEEVKFGGCDARKARELWPEWGVLGSLRGPFHSKIRLSKVVVDLSSVR